MTRQSEKLAQDRTEPTAQLKFESVELPVSIPRIEFRPSRTRDVDPIQLFASHRLKYSRPPDLYLRHHAFLI